MNVLTMFLGNIPNKESSYNSTQAHILKDMLESAGTKVHTPYGKEIPDHASTIYLYLGFGFNPIKPTLNIFGGLGANDFVREHLIWLSKHTGDIICLEHEFPNLVTDICNRINKLSSEDTVKWEDFDAKNLMSKVKENKHLVHPAGKSNNIVIGDSHAYSLYRPGYAVKSVPHKTLHGALKEGIASFLPDTFKSGGHIDIMFGNIDIRHHICRQPDTGLAINTLCKNLAGEMEKLATKYKAQVSFYELLPIENESRNLSKSGWYKGTPFYGDWESRNRARNMFNEKITDVLSNTISTRVVKWTNRYMNTAGELDFEFMERPRGVHLSGAHLPFWSRRKTCSADW